MRHSLILSSLHHQPHLIPVVSDRIWHAWWQRSGVSLENLTHRVAAIAAGSGPGANPARGVPQGVVAVLEGRYVGSALLIPADDDAFPQLNPWIAALWTEPAARGQGIATAMMEHLRAQARAGGYDAVYLGAKSEKIPFYETRGYQLITRTKDGSGVFSYPLRHLWREERPEDVEAIATLTRAAFATVPQSSGTEVEILAKLRKRGELSLSLVVEEGGETLAHIAFSPVTIGGGDLGWLGLGPLCVAPSAQGRGIGQALVREGLLWAESRGARGCVVLGNPRYYRRFGFAADPQLKLSGVPPQLFQALSFDGVRPVGEVAYSPAFKA